MSCWVAPTIAAEIWGISVERVLRMIEAGEVAILKERGWTFVDIAPGSPVLEKRERPQTYTTIAVSDEEFEALGDLSADDEPKWQPEEEESDPDASSFKHWGGARQRTQRLRLAPAKFQTI